MNHIKSLKIGLIIKILILVGVIALVFVIYSTCAGSSLIQKIDKSIPDISTAPYEVTTVTKLYIAQEATVNKDNSVTMLRWYERDGKKWIFREESITLPSLLKPVISKRVSTE